MVSDLCARLCRAKLYIFDLDQTLVDTLKRFYKLFLKTLRSFGKNAEIPWEVFIEHYRKDTLVELLQGVNPEEFTDRFLSNYKCVDPEDRLIEGAKELLQGLKAAGKIVCITTGRRVPESDVWDELRYFGIDKYVDAVLTDYSCRESGFSKKLKIVKCMEMFGVGPNETVFVGDYWVDVASAKAAGVFTIGLYESHMDEEVLKSHGADLTLRNVKELYMLLKRCGCLA